VNKSKGFVVRYYHYYHYLSFDSGKLDGSNIMWSSGSDEEAENIYIYSVCVCERERECVSEKNYQF
jgi:hypothetical protein